MSEPCFMRCPILTAARDSLTYCTSSCMAFMEGEKEFGCKLINKNSEEESWHKKNESVW